MCVRYEKKRLTKNYSKMCGPSNGKIGCFFEMGSGVEVRAMKSSIIDG